MDQSTDMEMLVTGIKVRPAQTPEPAATDHLRTRRTSDRAKRARNASEIFFHSSTHASARGARRARGALDRRLSRRSSLGRARVIADARHAADSLHARVLITKS